MEKLQITEAAKLVGLSRDKCRYWSNLLQLPITKEGRVSYIPAGSDRLLNAMREMVEGSTIAPAVAAAEVRAVHALSVESPAPICTQDNEKSAARITELEKAVLLLAESNQAIIKQNQDLITQVKELAAKISHQSMKLDRISAKLPPPAPIKQPEQPKKAVAKVPLLKRLWLELFDPVKLRAI